MITYEVVPRLAVEDFIDLLQRSSLAKRRPIDDLQCMQGMVDQASLILVAKEGKKIVGIARSVTDFSYCCYVSDLAVDQSYQRAGIGKMLIAKTKEKLLPSCKLILLSAPDAVAYYPKVGFEKHSAAFVLK